MSRRPHIIAYNVIYPKTFGRYICSKFNILNIAYTVKSSETYTNNINKFDLFIFENIDFD